VKLPNAAPKPAKSRKRAPKGLKRTTRMRQRNAKRQGSAFPEMRDAPYCSWVVATQRCVGLGLDFPRRIGLNDRPSPTPGFWRHVCWGDFTPAHVGKHRAQGVPDRGRVVNMCQALHDYYDNRRGECNQYLPEHLLENYAAGLALKCVESGGSGDPNP